MIARAFGCLSLLVLAILLVVLHPLLLGLVATNLVADDPLQPSDVLIVLGGNSPARSERAVSLYRDRWAPRLLIADERVKTHGLSTTWRDLYERGIVTLDVPSDAVVVLPGLPENTRDEALRSRDLMLQHGWQRAIVVTDPFHTHRAQRIFRAVFEPSGLEVRVSAARGTPDVLHNWWTRADGVQTVASECAKFAWAILDGAI